MEPRCALLLFVVPDADEVPWCCERRPGNVEPAVTGEELVGVVGMLEEIDQALELLRVARADIGSLAEDVLRVLDATDQGVDAAIAEA